MKDTIIKQLELYIADGIALAQKSMSSPECENKRENVKMCEDNCFGAIDVVTNIMEYSKEFTKEEIDAVYQRWFNEWLPMFKLE